MNLLEKHSSYVAYFDLLGFKRAILANEEEACNCLEALRVAVEEKNRMLIIPVSNSKISPTIIAGLHVRLFFFSDSILMYSLGDSEEDLLSSIGIAGRLMAKAMYWRLPIRGGIAHGDFYTSEKYNMFCGIPAVKAWELSEMANWMGLVLDDIVAETYLKLTAKDTSSRDPAALILWDVPLKGGGIRQSWVFNWPIQLDPRDNNPITPKGLFEVFKPMFNCEYDSLEPDVQSKYVNTSRFINFVDEKFRVGFKS